MIDIEKEEMAAKLRGSLLEFTRFFFNHLTSRDFIISNPIGRESHQITVCRELTKLFRQQIPSQRLMINLPPGHGKSLLVCMWIAWCYTHYPDCNFLYISYSHDLASKHTSFIKQIMSSRMYKYLFDISIKQDTKAKDHFMTEAGGTVAAFGAAGSVTGRDAGLPNLERFSGGVIIDDPVKPDQGHSDTVREKVNKNYEETIRQRTRGVNVPIVFIGQRIHEDDLGAYFLNNKDIRHWDKLILKSMDDAGNALYPEVNPIEMLLEMKNKSPYVFSSQFQQDPLPAGGGLYKRDWFAILDNEPQLLTTFITADTAETSKAWNDATVFSFFGVYEIENFGRKTGVFGLHWLDCVELRIEPKDLKDAFLEFWQDCNRHKVPPLIAAIEKKSTGVTLVSVLQELRGMQIRNIERNKASGSKTQRFLEMQPYIASKQISFTKDAKHIEMCINHMTKITSNDTHRHDDICDSLYDGIRIALIDKSLSYKEIRKDDKVSKLLRYQNELLNEQGRIYGDLQNF